MNNTKLAIGIICSLALGAISVDLVEAAENKHGEIEIVIDQGSGIGKPSSNDGFVSKPKAPAPKTKIVEKEQTPIKEKKESQVEKEQPPIKEKKEPLVEKVENNNQESASSNERDQQQLRLSYLQNCNHRASLNDEQAKVKLVKCGIFKNEIFQIYYDLAIEPDANYERGKNIPLARHYPRMRATLCENVEDLNEAGFVAIKVYYQYKGKSIQSNYLDLNDCYLMK